MYRIGNLSPGEYVVQVPAVQSSVPGPSGISGELAASSAAHRDFVMPSSETHVGDLLGRYMTPLPLADGRSMAYPPTFYPNARTLADAVTIQLGHGDDRSGLDVQLAPVPAFRLAGVVVGPPEALANLTLRLLAHGTEPLGDGGEVATALVDEHGAFTFLNVPEGSYALDARRAVTQLEFTPVGSQSARLPRPPGAAGKSRSWYAPVSSAAVGTSMAVWTTRGDSSYWARQEVALQGRDLLDVQVELRRAAVMSGHFVWDDAAPPATSGFPAWVRLEPAAGDVSLGLLQSNPSQQGSSRFHIEGLLPGEYVLKTIRTYYVRSISWNGQDYTYRPFGTTAGQDFSDVRVILTTQTTELSGSVQGDTGRPDDRGAVLAFPVEREQWTEYGLSPTRIASVAVTNTARYRVQNLPAGTYFAVAVPAVQMGAWKDPAFLERAASSATRFSIRWGEQKTVDLKIVSLDR
jgi:hypothetical protein